jgi:hypothetical protein
MVRLAVRAIEVWDGSFPFRITPTRSLHFSESARARMFLVSTERCAAEDTGAWLDEEIGTSWRNWLVRSR